MQVGNYPQLTARLLFFNCPCVLRQEGGGRRHLVAIFTEIEIAPCEEMFLLYGQDYERRYRVGLPGRFSDMNSIRSNHYDGGFQHVKSFPQYYSKRTT